MDKMVEIQTLQAHTTAELASVQRLLAGVEKRQEDITGRVFSKLDDLQTNSGGMFADWFGRILVPVVSTLIALLAFVLGMMKFGQL